jgi:hypothetical protein
MEQMTNDLKKQFAEAKQEKDPILRLKKLKALRNKTVSLLLNDEEEIKPEKNETTELKKLLDLKLICKN